MYVHREFFLIDTRDFGAHVGHDFPLQSLPALCLLVRSSLVPLYLVPRPLVLPHACLSPRKSLLLPVVYTEFIV